MRYTWCVTSKDRIVSVARQVRVAVALMISGVATNAAAAAQFLTQQDVARLAAAPAQHRVAYGNDRMQFGDLRLPDGEGPHPVAIVIHGGCWLSAFADLQLMAPLADALTRAGVATWNIEFRSADNVGGGWPGTLLDVARAVDHTRELAAKYPLDLKRVVAVGHSAGGHLALWAAARHRVPNGSPLFVNDPLHIGGVVSLAGISDLKRYLQESSGCGKSIPRLMGGLPNDVPERYQSASPIEMLPLGVRQVLFIGAQDPIVRPPHNSVYATAAQQSGDSVHAATLDGAAHFEVIAPSSSVWPTIENAVLLMLNVGK